MSFEIVRKGQLTRVYKTDVFYLLEDGWNDWFRYVTMFRLVYADAEGRQFNLGSAKFGQFQMLNDQKAPALPGVFERLDERFFSLGQSEEYYENIKTLENGEYREELLKALRDIAFDLDLFEAALQEDVTTRSLLRDVRRNTVVDQFHRIAHGGAKLTAYDIRYLLPGQRTTDLSMEFHVIPNSYPPTNIHVLIGRNGVGKTHLFQSMIHCLAGGRDEQKYGRFILESTEKLSNFVCVAFSPFDAYPHEEELGSEEEHRNRYTYIGLNNRAETGGANRLRSLEEQFARAFEVCATYREKRILWTEIVSLLNSDPIFRSNRISELLTGPRDGALEPAGELFAKLSSGHKVVLLTLTQLIAVTVEKTLVLMDEPENHLHPPLLSAMIRALSELLVRKNGFALIATHSPIVLQEVPRSCVRRLSRTNTLLKVESLDTETFGESVHTLTNEIFGLEVTYSGFHKMIADMAKHGASYEEIMEKFHYELGAEARAIAKVLTALEEQEG